MAEPKKFSFGFSKVAKKPTLFAPKPVETVEYIKCVEDKTVKLVHEEVVKPKELPIIPMPPGSSVRDRILEAVKAREAKAGKNKSSSNLDEPKGENGAESTSKVQNGDESAAQNGVETIAEEQIEAIPLTLDEMAAKELLENARMETEEKKEAPVIVTDDGANRKQSTLDDYENMPINDFGLAMLRGMGWDPKKGIGLNEKVVTPDAPQLRPKGMGLGADKALVAQTQPGKASAEEAVMKKGSMVKVIHGPYSQLYGKVEGFEELPGRILVRLTLSNTVVSLSEFMVQLVGPTEYNKNSKVMNLDKYNAALEPDTDRKPIPREIKSENRSRETHSKPVKRIDERRSRSPAYGERSSGHSKPKKKKDRSRDRASPKRSKKRDSSESDSSDNKHRKRRSPERRRHKSSKKSKYQSSGSSDDSDSRRSKKSEKSSKSSKQKSYRCDSDSSPQRYRKKHKKSRK